jgi:ubiquinone/menaquinone biosynthesis C-methylase UbiE|tara:strand:+ start:248 stop:955 length:708 start_codon:yes stop_codon:yes gene_type:complete
MLKKEHIKLYKLARNRDKSEKDYFIFEKHQAEMVINPLKRKIKFKGAKVLDIGSGRGGYSYALDKNGASVVSLDLDIKKQPHLNKKFVNADATNLPFKAESFDIVFCSSIIEHLKNPKDMILEIKRVLKKRGICYLSFPPFWSPVGAHQFKPFHYLGEKNAIRLARKFYKVRSHSSYHDEYGVLYIMTLKKAKKLIRQSGLKIKDISTRHSPINLAKIPFLNEFLTWHVEFLIQK